MARIIKGTIPVYASLLREQFDESIPFDVTFEIVDKSDDDAEHHNQVKGDKREVKAHKMILATFSSVFRAMFFGPMKESQDVIPVKETTFEAFKKLIDYFYQVDIDCGEIEVIDLFDIVNLAERSNVPELKEELKEQMEKVPIAMENLIEVATIASKFSQFEEVSSALLLNCAKLFQREVHTAADQVQFMLDQRDRGESAAVAVDILALSKTLPPLECENCKEQTCLDGQLVEHAKFVPGLKVKVSTSASVSGYWGAGGGSFAAKRYIVVNVVSSTQVRIWDVGDLVADTYPTVWNNSSTLCYNCS